MNKAIPSIAAQTLNEVSDFLTEERFNIRWHTVRMWHTVGRMILASDDADKVLERLCSLFRHDAKNFRAAVGFAKKYDKPEDYSSGKDINWYQERYRFIDGIMI